MVEAIRNSDSVLGAVPCLDDYVYCSPGCHFIIFEFNQLQYDSTGKMDGYRKLQNVIDR